MGKSVLITLPNGTEWVTLQPADLLVLLTAMAQCLKLEVGLSPECFVGRADGRSNATIG